MAGNNGWAHVVDRVALAAIFGATIVIVGLYGTLSSARVQTVVTASAGCATSIACQALPLAHCQSARTTVF